MDVKAILCSRYPAAIVDKLLEAYREIEHNYVLRKWKASELDAGHFVEAARRAVEHELFGTATPIGVDLPKFSDAELRRYAQATGEESVRILIPRVLWSVFGIRNKRGVGHVGLVSPNQMDSALILAASKWVLAEFVRLASGLSPAETQKLVDAIVERKLDLLWKHGDITRVLASGIPAREQVLLLLYDTSPQKAEDLRTAIEYRHKTEFLKLLKKLHQKRLINFEPDSGLCLILPPGVIEAEEVARKRGFAN